MLLVGIQSAPREVDLADIVVREVDVVATNAHICDTDLPEALDLLAATDIAEIALDRIVDLEQLVDDGLRPLAEGRGAGRLSCACPGTARLGIRMPEQQSPTPTLHHVNLKTLRLAEMVEWYGRVLGMAINHVCETGAWLTNDAANHRLALLTVPGLRDDEDKLTTPACIISGTSSRRWMSYSTLTSA